MPYKSKAQERLIKAAAHNKEFAKKVGFEQSAAKKFMKDSEGEPKPKVERVGKFDKLKKLLKL